MGTDDDGGPAPPPTVRHRSDTDGCGCLKCQNVDYDAVRRSFGESFLWSGRLLWSRPSILLVFVAVAFGQLLATRGSVEPGISGAVVGFLGVFLGRGYVGLSGGASLTDGDQRSTARLRTAVRRFPTFLAALALLIGILTTAVLFVAVGVPEGLDLALGWLGLPSDSLLLDGGILVSTAMLVVYLLVKFCFVPEACFVGGYGPLAALQTSWRLTTVHRRKAIALTVGLLALFAVSTLLEGGLTGGGRPVVFSVTFDGTTVAIRSIGMSTASLPRLLADAGLSALYYGVFVHQYVQGLFAEGPEPVNSR